MDDATEFSVEPKPEQVLGGVFEHQIDVGGDDSDLRRIAGQAQAIRGPGVGSLYLPVLLVRSTRHGFVGSSGHGGGRIGHIVCTCRLSQAGFRDGGWVIELARPGPIRRIGRVLADPFWAWIQNGRGSPKRCSWRSRQDSAGYGGVLPVLAGVG